ncbi:hypothetical protein [Neomegalonema perideroedes]|uniref:hypothetical protein n=1 Tax=Neomegalonema perideroedes TaxID=217219 RepID=UPI000371F16F|nr:hypothetical protein [Neomegalonema perideroedes]
MNARFTMICLALLSGLGSPAAAQQATPRDLEVEVSPDQGLPGVALEAALEPVGSASGVRVGPGAEIVLRDGDLARVCVQADQPGYVSIWSRTQSRLGQVRIYPNDHTPQERALKGGPLPANERRCFGAGEGGYVFRVRPPLERAEVYVHWSRSLAEQFEPRDLPWLTEEPSAKSLETWLTRPYASARLRYRIAP